MKKTVLFLLVFATLSGCRAYDYDQRGRASFERGDQAISQQRERLDREEERIKEERRNLLKEEERIIVRGEEPFREIRNKERRPSSPSRIETGTVEISGDFDLSLSSFETEIDGEETADIDTTKLDLSLLYYVAPDFGLGVVFFAEEVETTSGGASSKVKVVAIGPQAGINIGISDLTNFRLLGTIFLADVAVTTSSGATEKADGVGLGLSAGMSHFIADSVSVNGGLSYMRMSLDTKSNNLSVDLDGLSLGVGLSVYIR